MAKQNKKQKHDQKRKMRVKQERKRRQGLPALLRKDPYLHEALNRRHPLTDCRINEEKLIKSREIVREQHEVFVEAFGSDEILAPGWELEEKYRQFRITGTDIT